MDMICGFCFSEFKRYIDRKNGDICLSPGCSCHVDFLKLKSETLSLEAKLKSLEKQNKLLKNENEKLKDFTLDAEVAFSTYPMASESGMDAVNKCFSKLWGVAKTLNQKQEIKDGSNIQLSKMWN